MFPSRIAENSYGHCLVAESDLIAGARVQRFEGRLIDYDEVDDRDIRHAILIEPGRWLIPVTPARFLNHSCEPNCVITDDLDVLTVRPVRAGEELTFCYNCVSEQEFRQSPESFFWDERWSFACACGSPNCCGAVNRYVLKSEGSDRFMELPREAISRSN